jgi:hypothetical protein
MSRSGRGSILQGVVFAILFSGYMSHPAAIFSARWNAGRATQRSI